MQERRRASPWDRPRRPSPIPANPTGRSRLATRQEQASIRPVAAEARRALRSTARALVLAIHALPKPRTRRLSPGATGPGVYGSGLEASEGRRRKQKWRAESTNPQHSARIGDRRKQMEAACSLMACKRSSVRARLAPWERACRAVGLAGCTPGAGALGKRIWRRRLAIGPGRTNAHRIPFDE